MDFSSGARWRALLIASTLGLTSCSEHSVPSEILEKNVREVRRPAAVARGKIEVDGGLVFLASAVAGSVTSLMVREGDQVKRGQLLLTQANDQASAAVSVARSELKLARIRLQAESGRLPELRRIEARYAQAARAGATQPQLADEAQQRLREAMSAVAVAGAEVEVAEERLEQAKAEAQQFVLRASEDGVVAAISTQQGSRLEAGETALTLLPARPLIVRAELNSAYVSIVREGMHATVASDMDTGPGATDLPQARLVRISPMYGNGRQQDDVQRGPVHVVECILEFDGAVQALVGQNVRVTFHD